MTRKQRIKKEIDFANEGAGSYLFCCLWDMMDDHEVTVGDFHNQTNAWKEAVVGCACEAHEHTPYEDLWQNIVWTAHREREDLMEGSKETAKKIKEYLIGKAIDGTLDLDFNNLDFSHLIGDGLQFDRKGKLEQGCGKEDCCQSN